MILNNFLGTTFSNLDLPQNIPVGCIPPACQPHLFWWPPVGVSTDGGVCRYLEGEVGIPTLSLRYLPPESTWDLSTSMDRMADRHL